jgi:hypothetical protein
MTLGDAVPRARVTPTSYSVEPIRSPMSCALGLQGVGLAESGIGRRYEGSIPEHRAVRLGVWRVEILRPETFGPCRAPKERLTDVV